MYKQYLPTHLLIALVIGIIWSLYSLQFLDQGIFWDLDIYQSAVTNFDSGKNPYELNGYLSFVYHPLVLRFMALFGNHLKLVLIGFYLISFAFFLKSLGNHLSLWLFSFLAFAYCGIGTISIGSGNVTVFFHLILLGIVLRWTSSEVSHQRNAKSISSFIFLVTVFSLVKPYMLAYLLIPIIATWNTRLQKNIWVLTLSASLLLGLTVLLSSLYFDTEFQSFLMAVQGQTLGKRDMGFGLLMYFYDYYVSAGPLIYRAFLLHFAILIALLLVTIFIAKRSKTINQPSFALLLYFLLTIFNPRLKVYDLFPALIALFIFFSSLRQTVVIKTVFILAYALSLSQLIGTPFFVSSGVLSEPLNVYYLTMGLLLATILILFLRAPNHALTH